MKNIVITGSTRGLGYAMAVGFLEAGMNVTVSGINPQVLLSLEKKLKQYKNQLLTIKCDVRSRTDVQNLWTCSLVRWERIDIWINNAGINQPDLPLWQIPPQDTISVLSTNLLGTVYGSQIAMQGMLKQKGGFIYNIEGFGSKGHFSNGLNLYGTTKKAVSHFTQALAREAELTPVKVGLLNPGMMIMEFTTGTAVGQIIPTAQTLPAPRHIFNILGDRPETVAAFLVREILSNNENDRRIVWMTWPRKIWRLLQSPFVKRELI